MESPTSSRIDSVSKTKNLETTTEKYGDMKFYS
jgi:hypothetical protein